MRIPLISVAFVLLVWITVGFVAAAPIQADRVDQIVNSLQTRRGVPGVSVAIGRGEQLALAKAYGESDVENHVPVTTATTFRTASIAKTLTAVAVMRLVEQGGLDLDKPVAEYLPRFEELSPFTTRQLLGHLAGIRHYTKKRSRESISTTHYPSVTAALRVFAEDPLLHEPGDKFHYSTFGYNLLGALVEKQAGVPFFECLNENVLLPAGMSSTRVDNHFAIIPHRSRGYFRPTASERGNALCSDLQPGELYNAPLHDTSMKIPGGGLVSTPTDLVRFALALNRGDLLKRETLEAMWTEQTTSSGDKTSYGLGFRLVNHRGERYVGHSGGQAGISTFFLLNPVTGASAAVMANLEDAGLQATCLALMDAAEGEANQRPTRSSALRTKAATDAPTEADVIKKLEDFVESERRAKDLPAVSLALVDGDRTLWQGGWGSVDEKQTVPADANTVYRVGSVSKLFTDMAAVKLIHEGKLDLDADIRTYLPGFAPNNPFGAPITLRRLMSHQSGLVREPPVGHYFDPTEPTLEATVDSLNQTTLVYKPGTRTKYSNAAIAVVGRIIEVVTGKPFEQHLQQELLDPLGMTNSSFSRTDTVNQHLTTAWMRTPHAPRFVAPVFDLGTAPAGNLYASVSDLTRFMKMVLGGGKLDGVQIVPAEVISQMLKQTPPGENDPYSYGLGFRLRELDGRRTAGHGGAVYGFSTQVIGLPEDGLGVVAVTALDGANGFTTRLCEYAARLLLAQREGKPLPDWEESRPIDRSQAERLEGRYTRGDDQMNLFEFDGRLYARFGHGQRELRVAPGGDPSRLVMDDLEGYGPAVAVTDAGLSMGDAVWLRQADDAPAPCPAEFEPYLGEYGWDHNTLYIYEDQGQLWALIEWFYYYPLTKVEEHVFAFPESGGLYFGEQLEFRRDAAGTVTGVEAACVDFKRRPVGLPSDEVFQIRPLRPVAELRRDALAATPPAEPGKAFRKPDLVELTEVEPGIKLDIRYASDRNFMGAPFYESAHAYLQRPAAQAVARAHNELGKLGYGLLIHDAYRPWVVTKMFWDGTPQEMRHFVANPDDGSRHNRGCAVDLTLYDLATGEPIEMVANYDEFSMRSYPLYPGGTGRQRWHRRLLRNAMEQQGFTIYEFEWWHFDYKLWRQYPIGAKTFEQLETDTGGQRPSS